MKWQTVCRIIKVSMMISPVTLMQLASAASAGDSNCAELVDARSRLECYDRSYEQQQHLDMPEKQFEQLHPRSYLTRSWDLDYRDDELLGEKQSPLRPHRASYLITRHSMQPNLQTASPTHPYSGTPADVDLNEIKFQFSQKAKVLNPVKMNFLGFIGFRLWGAYTQQSNWQAFNAGNSSPFRETNYEPELIATFNTGNPQGLKLINLAYVHQSNGRDLGNSRSWNRMYVQGGWETPTITILARTWWRIPEDYAQDDNPDIEEYIGRAELNLRWEPEDNGQVLDISWRNNLRFGENRSFLQLDWATPVTVSQSTKLHIQLTSGYGESLIDYNHSQTTIGLGVSFRDW